MIKKSITFVPDTHLKDTNMLLKRIFLVLSGIALYYSTISAQLPCPPPISLNMTLESAWDNPTAYPIGGSAFNDVWGYVDGSQEYAILGGRDSIYIIDISDPENPVKNYSIYQSDTSTWRDMKVYQHYLYAIADSGPSSNKGVTIYDLSQLPDTVTYVGSLDQQFTRGHNIFIDTENARLYAVGIPGNQDVCVYDLSDPANPALWDCIAFDTIVHPDTMSLDKYYIHDIFVRNNIAYCSHGYMGYFIWDMNDKSNVHLLGAIDGSNLGNGYVHSSWNTDDNQKAVVATEVGSDPKLYLIDQADLENMDVLYEWKEPLLECNDPGNTSKKIPHNPYIIGDHVYVSHYNDGLQVLKIADDTLGRVAYYDTYTQNNNYNSQWNGNWGVFPFFPSGMVVASDQAHGLHTLSMTTCQLEVHSTMPAGPGTLRSALYCAEAGDTVLLMQDLAGEDINFGSAPIVINKEIVLMGETQEDFEILTEGTATSIVVTEEGTLKVVGLHITSQSDQSIIENEGHLILEDVTLKSIGGEQAVFDSRGLLDISAETTILIEDQISSKSTSEPTNAPFMQSLSKQVKERKERSE